MFHPIIISKFISSFFDTMKTPATRIRAIMEEPATLADHVSVRLIVWDLNANFALEVIFNPFLPRILPWCEIVRLDL